MTMPPNAKEPAKEPIDTADDTDCSSDVDVPSEFICPITQELMRDPVMSKYGHSYERQAILKWLVNHKECPMSRQPLKLSDLLTNHNLRSQIRRWQIENQQDLVVVCSMDMEDDPRHLERMLYGYYFIDDPTEHSNEDEFPLREATAIRLLDRQRRQRQRSVGDVSTPTTSNSRRGFGRNRNRSGRRALSGLLSRFRNQTSVS